MKNKSINVRGRLQNAEEFARIVIKRDANGVITRLGDVTRIDLDAQQYALRSLLDNKPAVAIPIFASPGANALEISSNVRATMAELSGSFPQGVDYSIVYDPTVFVSDSIKAVVKTLLEAIALVVLVVVIFLQNWRASIIPLLAVPVSIVGTFALMLAFGWFFRGFNRAFARSNDAYGSGIAVFVRRKGLMLTLYAGLLGLTYWGFQLVPPGFVPTQDKQYLVSFAQLPQGATLERIEAVIQQMSEIALAEEGVTGAVAFPGLSINGLVNSASAGIVFVTLDDFDRRTSAELSGFAIAERLQQRFGAIDDAFIAIFPAPPVRGLGLGTVGGFKLQVDVRESFGPETAMCYNAFRSADLTGNPAPGYSSGQAQAKITKILRETLPQGFDYEWTELTYQQILAGNTAVYVFPLCLVFLVLAAQYESLTLPLAVILIVPMSILAAIFGVYFTGGDNNIFTQVSLFVLAGLASKNAILIVEFARELEHQGCDIVTAAIEASRLRLRPILMTSFAFIMGVVPLGGCPRIAKSAILRKLITFFQCVENSLSRKTEFSDRLLVQVRLSFDNKIRRVSREGAKPRRARSK